MWPLIAVIASAQSIEMTHQARLLDPAGERAAFGLSSSDNEEMALAKAREIVVEWQGGISLAHALGDATVLAESFRRAEQRLVQG